MPRKAGTDKNVDKDEDSNRVQLMKKVRTFFGDDKYSDYAGHLFKKIVPMMLTSDNKPGDFKEVLNYSKWSYSGAAFWPLPLVPKTNSAPATAYKVIMDTYFTAENPNISQVQPLVDAAGQVCDFLCPKRWFSRAILFVLFIAIVCYSMASIWFFSLRKLFKQWYFMVFVVATLIFVMLIFSCDPYWKEHRQQIFFLFIVIAAGVSVMWRIRQARAANYP